MGSSMSPLHYMPLKVLGVKAEAAVKFNLGAAKSQRLMNTSQQKPRVVVLASLGSRFRNGVGLFCVLVNLSKVQPHHTTEDCILKDSA